MASFRSDGKMQRNEVNVTMSKAQSSSPTYRLLVSRNGEVLGDVSGRFAAYRDLYNVINADNSCDKLLQNKFPPTLTKRSLGVKMTAAEVEARKESLDKWMRELFNCFSDLPAGSRSAIARFVKLPVEDLELVSPPEPETENSPSDQSLQEAAKVMSMKGLVSVIKRTVSSKSGTVEGTSVPAVRDSMGIKAETAFITVYVSRGSEVGGHQMYEINIKYHPRERRMIVSKEFKHYRMLMQTLAAHGIRHQDYASKDYAPDAGDNYIKVAEFNKVIPIAHEFPRTHKRSALGISLSEDALLERCCMLDKWMKDVLSLYHSFEPAAKSVVNAYLGYTDDFQDEIVTSVIEKLNIPGAVIGNRAENVAAELPQLQDRPNAIEVKAISPDAQGQKSVTVTQEEENGHPVYTLQVFYCGLLLGEVKGQFAKFRDLFMKMNTGGYITGLLTAPFPATKRRSSLGMKLTDDMLEVRCAELKTWWIDLVSHFPDIKDDYIDLIAEFLSIPRTRLELKVDIPIPSIGISEDPSPAIESVQPHIIGRQEIVNAKDYSDRKMTQLNSVDITQAPENGHPVFTLRIIRGCTMLAEKRGQFAMFRDLQCLLIEEGGLDGLISAPFPVTLRRSSIGVRMNAEAVEMRRQALNAWWTDLLHNFNDLKVELQLQIAEFLGLSPDDLALVDLSSMLQGTSVINELTKEAGGVRVVEEVMVDMPLCIDCVDPEWQEIPAVKNPQGCCIIS